MQPATSWTVASLAREIGLSRTVLTNRFRRLVGTGAIAYVIARRMQVAVGYESEICFNRAFPAVGQGAAGKISPRAELGRELTNTAYRAPLVCWERIQTAS